MNSGIRKGRMGIMPIGALSIAFATYIQGVDTFIESGNTHYGIGQKLSIKINDDIKEIMLTKDNYADNIMNLAIRGKMPEVILFSPPNHRLMSVLDEVIDMIGEILKLKQISYLEDNINRYIPKFVMLSNGIYYDDVINYLTKNFDYVDDNLREKIIGNFIRATTIQTGTREEDSKDFIFKPGTKGGITIAGGSQRNRERIIELFKIYEYPVIYMEGEEVRRIEFDKAIINLSANGVQLSLVYDEEGNFHNFTLGDLVSDAKMQDMCKKIIHTMVSIGVKAGIYKNKDISQNQSHNQSQNQFIDTISQDIWKHLETKSRQDNVHIVSSLAIVIEKYRQGKTKDLTPRLPPLEENIVNYLLKLTEENNLIEEKKTIEELRDSILHVCGEVACM